MKIVILNGLGDVVANKCLESMLRTSNIDSNDVVIIKERKSREHTLNHALSVIGVDDDILFVGDDIEFLPNWYFALQNYIPKADILGMTMLYPNTTIVRDRGYRLVSIDGCISLQPIDRGKDALEANLKEVSKCDSVCGCFFFVKRNVFTKVNEFREDGKNRWGEFIFTMEASKLGATVGVINNNYLYHHGHGTKINKNKNLSSTSYLIELPIWSNIVEQYVDKSRVSVQQTTKLESTLLTTLNNSQRNILLYGAGTVTEIIFKHIENRSHNITLCTGLQEEVGYKVCNLMVRHINDVNLDDYDWIMITPLDRGISIYNKHIKNRVSINYKGLISNILQVCEHNILVYSHVTISI